MKKNRWLTLTFLVFIGMYLAGCAATMTAIRYSDLDVQTQMSDTIFLDPAPQEKRTAWIEVRDTSGEGIDLNPVRGLLAAKGYKVIDNPNRANYRVQINARYVGKTTVPAIKEAVHAGYGGPLTGAVAGGVIGGTFSDRPLAPLAGAGIGGLLGLGAEWIAGELVKKVTYGMVVDIQISEYSAKPVKEKQTANIRRGGETRVQQEISGDSNWKVYTTRIGANATQANLTLDSARPVLTEKLSKSIAGMF